MRTTKGRGKLGLAAFISVTSLSLIAGAADLKWTGEYRAEGNFIKNFTLDKNAGVEDSYIQHHLVMEPEIIPTDGLKIHARMDLFNNALAGNTGGQIFGQYTGPSGDAAAQPPAVFSGTQQPDTIALNALYMNWINEFSALTVGRVPINFGLGMTYSDGEGPFDHYISNKDMVAYKLVLGNLTIMPAYGKVREGFLQNEDDINDYMAVAEYNNSETDLSMGFMFDQRVAPLDSKTPAQGDDLPLSYFSGNASINPNFGAASYDPGGAGYSAYNMNFYVKKKSDNFNIGVELGFQNGYTGIQVLDSGGNPQRVNLSGFGGVVEAGYKMGDFSLDLKAGMASGDDPDTATFEGFAFNGNYDIAMLMFNYPVGQPGFDALRSSIYGSRVAQNSAVTSAQAMAGLDTELITNAIFAAPKLNWAMGERYDLSLGVAWATQVKPSQSASVAGSQGASQIGLETDLGFRYHPSKNFQWLTGIGVLFPGAAYRGSANFAADIAYGATSKAAISF